MTPAQEADASGATLLHAVARTRTAMEKEQNSPVPAPGEPRRPEETRPSFPRPVSRRATVLGGVVALLVVAGLGWLGWDLTHQDSAAGGARGAASGAGGAGGGGRAGGGGGGGFAGASGRG